MRLFPNGVGLMHLKCLKTFPDVFQTLQDISNLWYRLFRTSLRIVWFFRIILDLFQIRDESRTWVTCVIRKTVRVPSPPENLFFFFIFKFTLFTYCLLERKKDGKSNFVSISKWEISYGYHDLGQIVHHLSSREWNLGYFRVALLRTHRESNFQLRGRQKLKKYQLIDWILSTSYQNFNVQRKKVFAFTHSPKNIYLGD